MHLNRKQKAKEKRSRQSDVMSDFENINVMLGNFPRNDYENHPFEKKMDSESDKLNGSVNPTETDFRSLLNTNSREKSELTVETVGTINLRFQAKCQGKLDKIKTDFTSQILPAINSAINEKVLPILRNSLGLPEYGLP